MKLEKRTLSAAGSAVLFFGILFIACQKEKTGTHAYSAISGQEMVEHMDQMMGRTSGWMSAMHGEGRTGMMGQNWGMMWTGMDSLMGNMHRYVGHMNAVMADSDKITDPSVREHMRDLHTKTGIMVQCLNDVVGQMEVIQSEMHDGQEPPKGGNAK